LPGTVSKDNFEFTFLDSTLSYSFYKYSYIANDNLLKILLPEPKVIMTFHLTGKENFISEKNIKDFTVLNSGDSFITGPSDFFLQKLSAGSLTCSFNIFIEKSFFLSILDPKEREQFKNRFFISGRITADMKLCIQQISRCTLKGREEKLYIKAKLFELIALRLEQIKEINTSAVISAVMQKDLLIISNIKNILNKKMRDPPSLPELAKFSGINLTKLKKLFKLSYGITPYRYLRTIRMKNALKLILNGDCNISEAAEQVGYSSKSSFTKAFTAEYGVVPSYFKQFIL